MARARPNADDREFLARYDPRSFPPVAVTADVVLFTMRRRSEELPLRPAVLLVRRAESPFVRAWALPGGFVRAAEAPGEAAARVLREKTGLDGLFLEQLQSFGAPTRDPRMRVVSIAHWALVDHSRLPRPQSGPRELAADWQELGADGAVPSPLAFDHDEIVETAFRRLRAKLEYTNVGAQLLPPKFTLAELQEVYEGVLGRELDRPNFRKKLLQSGLVKKAAGRKEGRHRPAQYFTFEGATDQLRQLHPPFRWSDEP